MEVDKKDKKKQLICTNTFKNENPEKIKSEFNNKWIELINFLENTDTYSVSVR